MKSCDGHLELVPVARWGAPRLSRWLILPAVAALAGLWFSSGTESTPRQAGAAPTPTADAPPPPDSPRAQIGIDRVEARLGEQTPTGKGIVFGHVEGEARNYLPDIASEKFKGVQFIKASGESKRNGHADSTAMILYGPGGLAPGVEQVVCFTPMNWITTHYLHGGTDRPPAANRIRVFTNSWIGEATANSPEVLRRVDYAIDHDGVIVVVGVNNRRDTPVPALLASAYNVISVGNWSGNNSGGYTRYEGVGRCKPEIVAPMGLTSFSTPVVAACAARLLETADRMGAPTSAGRSEVIKAVLLAGADKPPSWKQEPGKPLDSHFGAGRLRFDHSYDILASGAATPGPIHNRYGWAFELLGPNRIHEYRLDLAQDLGEASLMLVWNRRIDGRHAPDLITHAPTWETAPRLADFDIKIVRIENDGSTTQAAASAGAIDNIEHIYLKSTPRGRYRIEVSRKDHLEEDWSYALAWRIEEAH